MVAKTDELGRAVIITNEFNELVVLPSYKSAMRRPEAALDATGPLPPMPESCTITIYHTTTNYQDNN